MKPAREVKIESEKKLKLYSVRDINQSSGLASDLIIKDKNQLTALSGLKSTKRDISYKHEILFQDDKD